MKYSALEGFNESANRDSKGRKGELIFLRHHERIQMINELNVFDIDYVLKIKS